jgi:hypothetical protein
VSIRGGTTPALQRAHPPLSTRPDGAPTEGMVATSLSYICKHGISVVSDIDKMLNAFGATLRGRMMEMFARSP